MTITLDHRIQLYNNNFGSTYSTL